MNLQTAITNATVAANTAGAIWLAQATPKYAVRYGKGKVDYLLDMCGFAFVKFNGDKRSRTYRELKSSGFLRSSGTLEIEHDYRGHQEHGLNVACATAAKESLEAAGIAGLTVWDWID